MAIAILFLEGGILMLYEGHWFPIPNLIGGSMVDGAAYGFTKRGAS